MSHVHGVFFVLGLSAGLCFGGGGAVVIDDADPGFTDHTGESLVQTAPPQFAFNSSAHHSIVVKDPVPDIYVSWAFVGLDATLEYDVAVTWGSIYPPGNLNGDAAYTILGATTKTTQLRHNVSPVADYVETDGNGTAFSFQTLARVKPKANGTIVLELRDEDGDALAGVVADAALVVPVSGAVEEPLVLEVDRIESEVGKIQLKLVGIEEGASYIIESSTTLDGDFSDTGVHVTSATAQPFPVPADLQMNPLQFFRAKKE
jgi:hypothetical protein